MNLEVITRKIEELRLEQKSKLDNFDKMITQLQYQKKEIFDVYTKEIEAATLLQEQLLGEQETVETESFVIYKKYPNLKSRTAYKLHFPKDKEEKERFDRYMVEEHPGLMKQEVVIKPIQNEIKQLLAEGVFHLTEEGVLIDDNGMVIPNTTVEVKGVEVKVKVKKNEVLSERNDARTSQYVLHLWRLRHRENHTDETV